MEWLQLLTALGISAGNPAVIVMDLRLYERALSQEAVYEFKCRGLRFDSAQKRFDRRYQDRQNHLRTALANRHLLDAVEPPATEIIPILFKCPHYRGAEARLRTALREAERQLDMGR